MARRKTAPTLAETLSTNIRQAREAREAQERGEWTQAKVAERMAELGFKWTRTTVAEVEGTGRGREVGIAEWLGLAEVFGVAAFQLLIPQEGQGTEVAISPKFSTESHTDLFARMVDDSILSRFTEDAFGLAWQTAIRSAGKGMAARMRKMAAGYDEAAAQARADAERLERDPVAYYAADAIEESKKGRKQ